MEIIILDYLKNFNFKKLILSHLSLKVYTIKENSYYKSRLP